MAARMSKMTRNLLLTFSFHAACDDTATVRLFKDTTQFNTIPISGIRNEPAFRSGAHGVTSVSPATPPDPRALKSHY